MENMNNRGNPIVATFNRLLDEAGNAGYFDKDDEKNRAEFFDLAKRVESEGDQNLDLHSKQIIALGLQLSNRSTNFNVRMAVHERILMVLMEHLTEASHRSVLKELAKLKVGDILNVRKKRRKRGGSRDDVEPPPNR